MSWDDLDDPRRYRSPSAGYWLSCQPKRDRPRLPDDDRRFIDRWTYAVALVSATCWLAAVMLI